MKKILFLTFLSVFVSCKEEAIKKPDHLIEKDKMVDIMYDLSLLEAVKYQNPKLKDTYNINPSEYIYKKYKIDSLQFVQNNIYYASNYKEYKDIFDQITTRLNTNKEAMDSLVNLEKKKVKKKDSLQLKKDSIELKKKSLIKKDTVLGKKITSPTSNLFKKRLRRRDSLRE